MRQAHAQGQLVEAEATFEQAWSLRQSYDIAGQLGSLELELGKYAEAANHLSFAIEHWAPSGNPDGKVSAEARLAKAREQVGAVTVSVSPASATLELDGHPIAAGRTYVDPGAHTFRATHDSYHPATETVNVTKGGDASVELTLAPVAGQSSNGDSSHPITSVLVAGYVVGGALAVTSVVLGVIAATHASDASSLEDELVAARGALPCATPDARCDELSASWDKHRDFANPALWLGVGAGATLLATVIYHVASGGGSAKATAVSITPIIDGRNVGVSIGARW